MIIRTLKRRREGVYRSIPLPNHLIQRLKTFIKYREDAGLIANSDDEVFSFSTKTGYRAVKKVMTMASIEGIQACPLGLRHGYAVHTATRVPLTQLQKWMGHVDLRTTAIYLQVSGLKEREWAEKCWDEEE